MNNDFYIHLIKKVVLIIKYIASVLYSLVVHCLLNNKINLAFGYKAFLFDLYYKEKFEIQENFRLCDFMLLDYISALRNSYYIFVENWENFIVEIIEIFSSFLDYFSIIINWPHLYSERVVNVDMDQLQSKSFEEMLRNQKKEDIRKKSKKAAIVKHKKMNSFKSSLEKLFHLKSKSEKSLKKEDLLAGVISPTNYLSHQEAESLSRDTWYIPKIQHTPIITTESIRHSCSDFVCRQSGNFCMIDTKQLDNFSTNQLRTANRSVSPPATVFSSVKEEEYQNLKVGFPSYRKVSHSISMPAHLSKSHQNVTKCSQSDLDNIKPAKRTARKKGLFNCSLFRKRSNSRSKSREKINERKSQNIRGCDKSKSLNRSGNKNISILSDRCLTLPNLKSSEVDLSHMSSKTQILSMDLIKDYLNRSDNSLHSSIQRNSADCSVTNQSQQFLSSVQNSPHSALNCKGDLKKFKVSKVGLWDSMILESPHLSESFYSQPSASTDIVSTRSSRAISPLTINNSAFDNTCYKYSNAPTSLNENQRQPCVRQISAPIYYQQSQPVRQPISPPHTSCAFEFWTRPYQEKMKASRRRLLDDKVGSKEALLRSLSPHNLKANEGNAIYDNPYYLHIIPEPITNNIPDCHNSDLISQGSIGHVEAFYNVPQYRSTNPENILHEYGHRRSTSPVIENRLSESPISISKRQEAIYQKCSNNYLIYNADVKNDPSQLAVKTEEIFLSQKEVNRTTSEKIFPLQECQFDGSLPEMKDNKSINSSSELVLTRTPTPPHSFAESSVSSIYPAPNEFISESSKSHVHPSRLCGTVNLLYTSDNSEDENDGFSNLDIEPIPPVPPPRTDSVIRSLQAQLISDADKSELEYDISEEFPPVFSGANIDRCDIEQYHKWLEKLPYKLSEFPNILQCRKSAVNACKISPLTENINSITKKFDLVALKELKESRKSIKSWNISESSKPSDSTSIESHHSSNTDSHSMKKSLSYDQSLNNSEMNYADEIPLPNETNQQIPTIDATLLKQYSHLYSLKPSPSQTPKLKEITSSVSKFNRSKSIDLRNFVNNISNKSILDMENSTQKRKSVPNSKFNLGTSITKEISGKSLNDPGKVEGSEYKVYPIM